VLDSITLPKISYYQKKFNVGTRLMIEFKQALQKAFESDESSLFASLQQGTEAISAAVKDRIMVLKSVNQA
jgi:fructose/tagatose bisphosphate aldolase